MTAPGRSYSVLAQLKALCQRYPQVPKQVLVPRSQIGRAIEDRLAREQGAWAGVTGQIVRHFAEQVARPRQVASQRTELPVGGRSVLAARLLEEIDPSGDAQALPDHQQVAGTVAEALETLRRAGAPLDDVQERAQSPEVSATFRVVAACYDEYLETLGEEALYDDAQVFAWATERVRKGNVPAISQSVVAVCDAVDLPPRASQFMRAVRSECLAFFRLGRSHPQDAPRQTAAALFPEVPPPETEHSPPATVRTRRAAGAVNEVKAVFRDVLADGVPLDEVEIAFAGEQPYVSLIADQADRTGVPVTIGTGVPVSRTRTGNALLSLFEWISDEFAAETLIRMLRSGHLRLDRIRPEIEDDIGTVDLHAHEVATLLAERRYEPGRDGYAQALGAALQRRTERIDELEDRGLDPQRERDHRRQLQFTRRVVDELLELVPRKASIQEMAANARRFIERLGPVDAPPEDKPEDERTLEEAARAVLWQRVDGLTDLPVDYEASGARLATLLRRWLEGQYVRAEHPRPGTAHVVPLESAGYGGRSHLYVVGLDGDTLSTAAVEDALLRDADRRALSESPEGTLPDSREAPDDALWRAQEALARHSGTLSLYTRVFDAERGEERYPSPLFLRLETAAGEEGSAATEPASAPQPRVEGFLPDPDRPLLSDAEGWLAAYRARGAAGTGTDTARDELKARHPWVLDGEAARRARQADEYTVHDGLLEAGDHPELDFLHPDHEGGSMSAGRLETFAETPYLYFLQYVLGVKPLDEPALDDEPWLNGLRRGSILHETFETFMETLTDRDERPRPHHESLLRDILRETLNTEVETVAPPNDVVKEAAHRQLLDDARLFLRAEVERCQDHIPLHFEVGFGYGPYRRREKDLGAVSLDVGGREMPLRGRIDRVDRREGGSLVVWDYKTGSASAFDEGEPLDDGARLQWALYAYALEQLKEEPVSRSGYYFTSADEMGTRRAFDPSRHRDDVERHLETLSRLARTGSFPMNPRARYLSGWRYRGYEQVVRDLADRSSQLRRKTYPEDRPVPPSFD